MCPNEIGDLMNKEAQFSWKKEREKALGLYGSVCMCCGKTQKDGVYLQADHIYPQSSHPTLKYSSNNLQILCDECNKTKSNLFSKDYRLEPQNLIRYSPQDLKLIRKKAISLEKSVLRLNSYQDNVKEVRYLRNKYGKNFKKKLLVLDSQNEELKKLNTRLDALKGTNVKSLPKTTLIKKSVC